MLPGDIPVASTTVSGPVGRAGEVDGVGTSVGSGAGADLASW